MPVVSLPGISSPAFSASTTSVNIDLPACNDSQLMVATLVYSTPELGQNGGYQTITVTPPAGWDHQITANLSHFIYTSIYTKFGDDSVSSIVWGFSSGVDVIITIDVVDNPHLTAPVSLVSSATSNSQFHDIPSVTVPDAGSLVFAAWGTTYYPVNFSTPANMQLVQQIAGLASILTVYEQRANPGAIGAKVSTSVSAITNGLITVAGAIALIVIAPTTAPSAPVVTAPIANESITIGRTYTPTVTSATDPNVAPGALTYEFDYSLNADQTTPTWTNIGTTAAGIMTISWNTTGLSPSTQCRIRCRANNGTEDGAYGYSGKFSLLNNATPAAPTGLYPTGVVSKSSNQDFGCVFNDTGDVLKELTLRYANNAAMTSPTDKVLVTSNPVMPITANSDILATTGQMWYQFKTKDLVGDAYGPFSSVATVLVAVPPTAPTITSPTAVSPPTTGQPTVIFSSSGHQKYKHRWVKDGVERYNSGAVNSGQSSFLCPLTLGNGETWTLYISIQDSNGLWSAESSQTFVVTYVGPATPDLTPLALLDSGCIQLSIENADPIEKSHLYRFKTSEGIDTAIKISPDLPANASYADFQVESGVEYSYFVRSFVSTGTGGYTDSAVETATLTLTSFWMHVVSQTSTSSNVSGVALSLRCLAANIEPKIDAESKEYKGREFEITMFGQIEYRVATYPCLILVAEAEKLVVLQAIYDANSEVCVRDVKGNLIFTKLPKLVLTDEHIGEYFDILIVECAFTEEIS